MDTILNCQLKTFPIFDYLPKVSSSMYSVKTRRQLLFTACHWLFNLRGEIFQTRWHPGCPQPGICTKHQNGEKSSAEGEQHLNPIISFIHLSKVNFSIVHVYDNTSFTFVFTQKDFRFLARSHYQFADVGRGQTDLEAGLLSWALSQSAPLALPTLQSIPALPITLFLPQNKLQNVNANRKAFLEQTLSATQCIFCFT